MERKDRVYTLALLCSSSRAPNERERDSFKTSWQETTLKLQQDKTNNENDDADDTAADGSGDRK